MPVSYVLGVYMHGHKSQLLPEMRRLCRPWSEVLPVPCSSHTRGARNHCLPEGTDCVEPLAYAQEAGQSLQLTPQKSFNSSRVECICLQEAWGGMGAPMELGAMGAARMGGRWGPWDRTEAMARAWGAATDPAMGAACMGSGLMVAITAMALALAVVTQGRLMEQAPCQVRLVGLSGSGHPCSAARLSRPAACKHLSVLTVLCTAECWQ